MNIIRIVVVCALVLIKGLDCFANIPKSVKEHSLNVFDENSAHTPLFINGITVLDQKLLVSCKGNNEVSIYSLDGKNKIKSWSLPETPTGITAYAGKIYVTASTYKGGVYVLDSSSDSIGPFIYTGLGACSPLVDKEGKCLYVCNQFKTTISEIDLKMLSVKRTVSVLREPKNIVMDSLGRYLFVANFLPVGKANQDYVSACVSVIDCSSFQKIKDIPLATGSNALRGEAISSDGKYVFVTHNLGRFQVPTSQLQQGWMNTSAMSVINVDSLKYEGSVLLDDPDRGAAGIWDINCTTKHIIISHSGTHEISLIDYPSFINKYEALTNKESLSYDLRFLGNTRKRISLFGNGPRVFTFFQDKAYIPTYFSDTLNIVDLSDVSNLTSVEMVPNRIETNIQKGEKYFNDAAYCFQNWQSCNGCHPGDGRTDGLNWDNLNDGIGNPKNCKSMLFAHETGPSMISGIRENAEVAVRAGFKYIQFNEVSEDIAKCVDEYLKNLSPVPSPLLNNGALSEMAKKGKIIFEKHKCDYCHSGPYYTDCRMHVIGDDVEFEKGWDTPTLREVWRTAPYLFDGRAATMKDVFKEFKHGLKNATISEEEIDELVEYVNSL